MNRNFYVTVGAAMLAALISASPALALDQFDSEAAAKKHCPKDTVVWLNLPTGVYHFAGERWYGRTKDGAFVCRREADAEGDRATKNGQ